VDTLEIEGGHEPYE